MKFSMNKNVKHNKNGGVFMGFFNIRPEITKTNTLKHKSIDSSGIV
jgi:hypothetical protein